MNTEGKEIHNFVFSDDMIIYVENLKKKTNKQKKPSKTPGHTAIFKMDNQQEPTVYHRELCLKLCGSLDGRGVWGRINTCICMAESLCYPPETITTLLNGYIPT